MGEEEYHDDETLHKVYNTLIGHGLTEQQATDAVSEMQNNGILFRERRPNGV